MRVPSCWKLVEEKFPNRHGGTLQPTAWGCGDDEASAELDGQQRLQRVAASQSSGKFPEQWYGYPDRPVCEGILKTIDGPAGDAESQVAVE